MRTQLLGVKNMDDAVSLFAALGYDRPVAPWDLGIAPIPGVDRAVTSQSGRRRRQGYGVVFAETSAPPRSLRPLARSVRDHVHDRPLVVLGVAEDGGEWSRMIVIRPRTTQTGGAVTVTKLDIDLTHPTQHDAEILNSIEWHSADDRASQRRVDNAFDVEAVTNRFFRGLAHHYTVMVGAVQQAMDHDPAVADRMKALGSEPASRAALRILTQVLFTQFLQRKGFVEGRKDWLNYAYRTKAGPYYQTVLERLFYSGLGTPRDRRKPGDPDVPYLNGGLFERFYGNISLPLPDEVFDVSDGLLGYLSGWTFTVHEDAPDEAEVAVDPEMLGKIFEHLSGQESVLEHGTVYTPRPVVHFMCREALIPWVEARLNISEYAARVLLTDDDPFGADRLVDELGQDRVQRLIAEIDPALDDLQVLDPAVGSGAFPLGMLAEIVRLRTLCHRALNQGADPGPEQVTAWKNHAIRSSLYGVDIEPRAIEMCRLRYWLSLLVDLPAGTEPQPLPNLEYRTVVADSLTDFVNGVEVQNTRSDGGINFFSEPDLERLHNQWYNAFGQERDDLAARIRDFEERVVRRQLDEAITHAPSAAARKQAEELLSRFLSRDREFPCFVPALLAPDVVSRGGWDIVIMNPPYIGAKEVRKRLPKSKVSDYERHHGEVNDLMILFAYRASELVKPGGVMSMIFNDSVTSSTDGERLRRRWTDLDIRSLARTRCFEGKAITGGVFVIRNTTEDHESARWVEGHGKPVGDFAEASDNQDTLVPAKTHHKAGELEVWFPGDDLYRRLPHRPLFRPSPEALRVVDIYESTKNWSSWSQWDPKSQRGWKSLSNTRALDKHIEALTKAGFYESLSPGDWLLLGLVTEGGVGLQTSDDRTFVAAIVGTREGDEHLRRQVEFEAKLLADPSLSSEYTKNLRSVGREEALLRAWQKHDSDLDWPRIGAFRTVDASQVRTTPLTAEERTDGISRGPAFVPYEKGDDSDNVAGRAIGAAWCRENPLVIDWSTASVRLLRERAEGTTRKPYFRNESMWFNEGVTWNRIASYFRVRQVPATAIFSDKAPTIRPTVDWLPPTALLALLNSDVMDFILRTLLGSRMQLEIGDVRRLPVPFLSDDEAAALESLGASAVAAKTSGETQALAEIESQVNQQVRRLYGIPSDAELWVVR